jgi:hypothetical protein
MIVTLDPNTLWRPRGSEVRFTIEAAGGTLSVTKVRVCFGWSSPDGNSNRHDLIGSPQVRPIGNDKGLVEYGALVPQLAPVPNSDWWPLRVISSLPYVFTGAFSVPVSDMVVEVTPASGAPFVTSIQVGVTSAIVAVIVVVCVAILVWQILYWIAHEYRIRGRNLLLRIICTSDGYASLSQLQIVLWTFVVGMSAIYVMTLSGNLISISAGTLTLLGIASGAGLLARIQGAPGKEPTTPPKPAPDASTPAAGASSKPAMGASSKPAMGASTEAAEAIEPEWADLVIPNRGSGEIDVTRLQMLAFTLIVAAFVVVKVVADYEIPTIPESFLVLLGISNGVYVGGRKLPSPPKHGGESQVAQGTASANLEAEQAIPAQQENPPATRE